MSVAAEHCTACSGLSLEPRGFCSRCGARAVSLVTLPGDGTIRSITNVYRPPASAGDANEPYGVALIELASGPRLLGQVPVGCAIGDAVSVSRARIDALETIVKMKDE